MSATVLCHIDDIPDPGSKGFRVQRAGEPIDIMVVRSGDEVHGYINSCPHTGVCLDWQPGQFLNSDNTLIICAMHGAEFRLQDGYCVAGPCAGDRLASVNIARDDAGRIIYPASQTGAA